MITIGRLARRFGLSRSTLLYYDSIGLLSPSSRSAKDYRLYSKRDAKRLEQICRYRRAGIALRDIGKLLDSRGSRLAGILEQRLGELNDEILHLHEQQRLIVGLLEKRGHLAKVRVMNRERWVSLLAASGFSSDDMLGWHARFERSAPQKHREFLELLCFSETEVRRIRAAARRRQRAGSA
jgi:DNA-binding transcriptional MerR regulator